MPRKPLAVLAASVSALAVAGLALAHGGGPGSVQAASATFDAATVTDLHSGTCTGADGTYTRTRATYTGNSTSSDARLNGTLTVKARTLYNSTTGLGVVQGRFRVDNADGHTAGKFMAVDTSGSLDGFVGGWSMGSHAGLVGSLTATFDPATGFNGGQLGTGSSTNAAVFVSGRCGGGDDQGSGEGHNQHHQHGNQGKHRRNGKR
ncbi:MAG TPA: hypothetical protein VI142_04945 [Gaiellaceae bacterium]